MEEPKKLWIGAEWQAERDHYGLDNRCGMFSTERFHEDDIPYIPADLTDALAEAAEEAKQQIEYLHGKFQETGTGNAVIARLQSALAAYRGDGEIICEGIELRRLKDVE